MTLAWLEELKRCQDSLDKLRERRLELISKCREAGCSFTDIADALSMSRQGARQLFNSQFEEVRLIKRRKT